MNDLILKAHVMIALAPARLRSRMRDDSGQTAAEYLGIIVVIAVIIGILAQSDIGDELLGNITDTITNIFNEQN